MELDTFYQSIRNWVDITPRLLIAHQQWPPISAAAMFWEGRLV